MTSRLTAILSITQNPSRRHQLPSRGADLVILNPRGTSKTSPCLVTTTNMVRNLKLAVTRITKVDATRQLGLGVWWSLSDLNLWNFLPESPAHCSNAHARRTLGACPPQEASIPGQRTMQPFKPRIKMNQVLIQLPCIWFLWMFVSVCHEVIS